VYDNCELQFVEAAQAFSDALGVIAKNSDANLSMTEAPSMLRQKITLLNNRSAMYEKAMIYELALSDCDAILELEVGHTKARTRKLRVLETLKRYPEALQEVCAAQLLFMQANRTNLRMRLPLPPPPVPQSKMEEILNAILPSETEKYVKALEHRNATTRRLPSPYTILQLLRSYTEYNAWMALAAKDGSVDKLTKDLNVKAIPVAQQAVLLFKRGRRYVYDQKYEEATVDFEHALALVEETASSIKEMEDGYYARILEWTGMVRHWHYDLDSAMQCLEKAADLEPENALLIVKQAGVQLDAGKQDEALKLFERALIVDPESADALLHRSNMRILQSKPDMARSDLETCVKLRPSFTLARLRLAAVLVPMEDMDGAKRQLDMAEKEEPNSSEISSYRGELHFAHGEMEEARVEFEKAIRLEPQNPTPYVNAALALINTPPAHPHQLPDTDKILKLLETAVQVDPQFSAAYVHLGQMKLGTATELQTARDVVELYDRALEQCRTADEIKELVGMRILAVAQVAAASNLNMEKFSFQ
jgi:mitochondrial import receptor subunit TOM70